MLLPLLAFGFGPVLCAGAEKFSVPNVNAAFHKSPKPFEIHVDRNFIEDTRQRVAHARAPVFIDAIGDGPSGEIFTTVKDFWVNEYSWNATEASINQKLEQFTTIVKPVIDNTSYPVPLHFIHHRSPWDDAIPLLFIHRWPGSFLEVSNIIGNLTNPPNASVPAFHVVAPSIPGFGFSPAPQHPGFGPVETSYAFNELMRQLGYSKYVIQGGDFGGVILRYQAHLFPKHVVSALSNFWIIQPEENDMRRLAEGSATPDEVIDPAIMAWTPEEIITWSMMYYIQGPYGGMRFYKEVLNDGGFAALDFGTVPLVQLPVAISQFPYDICYRMPLDWAKRGGNVLKRTVNDHGGHFAAYEVPGLLLNDIWSWFGNKEVSGTRVFVN
ncbi:Alpha/Beta hydrolase protein [Dactylonectria estremocensis]|uniref:Alpha/Beta hydrolase protein n=1 Tax=Dactylonectria estremocensis TaxID=1079267 RepID=A0A9P9J8B3_9HYPO|nr:Alpha/Beta hydrolase protein [Dactylonectria estremocensis]